MSKDRPRVTAMARSESAVIRWLAMEVRRLKTQVELLCLDFRVSDADLYYDALEDFAAAAGNPAAASKPHAATAVDHSSSSSSRSVKKRRRKRDYNKNNQDKLYVETFAGRPRRGTESTFS